MHIAFIMFLILEKINDKSEEFTLQPNLKIPKYDSYPLNEKGKFILTSNGNIRFLGTFTDPPQKIKLKLSEKEYFIFDFWHSLEEEMIWKINNHDEEKFNKIKNNIFII